MANRLDETMMDYTEFEGTVELPQAAPQPALGAENASHPVAVGPEAMETVRANGDPSEMDVPKPQATESQASSPQEKEKDSKPAHDFRKCEVRATRAFPVCSPQCLTLRSCLAWQLASLQKYIEHHGLTAKPDASIAELAALVGR